MSIVGDWDVSIKTPVGTLHIKYSFREHGAGISGSAAGKHETVPLTDLVVTDTAGAQRVTWRQTITKPLRLTLDFDVLVDGDRFDGHSRAGRLPRSEVTGARAAPTK
jgi:hypothetical protein